ncbi:MAG: hypothetical protein ACYCXB_04445 [Candidatus Humimicrobiaceae bacterium]
MKNIKKFLVISIIFLAIGVVGLIANYLIFDGFSQGKGYGTSSGYIFEPEDMMNMMRGFIVGQQNNNLKNISFDEVKSSVEKYLNDTGLQNVKIKEIMEFSNNFYIETVEEKTGFGAMELLFDKTSGAIFPEYGPNMMWNQKYGMMHSIIGSNQFENNMKIDEAKAIKIANNYLAKLSKNEFAENESVKFYGYYTIDTVNKDGAVVGMLSVNGFNGQVWYHSWHGTFIEMKEYE